MATYIPPGKMVEYKVRRVSFTFLNHLRTLHHFRFPQKLPHPVPLKLGQSKGRVSGFQTTRAYIIIGAQFFYNLSFEAIFKKHFFNLHTVVELHLINIRRKIILLLGLGIACTYKKITFNNIGGRNNHILVIIKKTPTYFYHPRNFLRHLILLITYITTLVYFYICTGL